MITGLGDFRSEHGGCLCPHFLRDDAPHERHALLCLCAGGIHSGLRIKEFVVDGLPDAVCKCRIVRMVVLLAEQGGGPGQYGGVDKEIYG